MNKRRCSWCNTKNPLYVEYHDHEWCKPNFEDKYLFEMLVLESFQAGLSWECILNKRSAFQKAYDNFDVDKVSTYDEDKISVLCNDKDIIRNKRKITASIENAKIFKKIKEEYGSFYSYLRSFIKKDTIYENDKTHSDISDTISEDLKRRGMSFVGTTIIYSYLQAVGFIYSHDDDCFLFKKEN